MFTDKDRPETEQPTEYFDIDAARYPNLKGDRTAEIINDPAHGPCLHLRTLDPRKTQLGNTLSKPDTGDVVFTNISLEGANAIGEIIGELDPDAKMTDIKRALSASDIFTPAKPSTGH